MKIERYNREQIAGLVALVECPTCDGEGKVYLTERDRFKSECPTCEGIGKQARAIGLAEVEKVVRDALRRIAEGG